MAFWSQQKMYGATDPQLAALAGRSRQAFTQANRQSMDEGLRGLAGSAAARGLGSSGSVALGVAPLAQATMQSNLQQEDQLQRLMQSYRNQRVYENRPGWGQKILGGAMQLGGTLGGAALGTSMGNPMLGALLGSQLGGTGAGMIGAGGGGQQGGGGGIDPTMLALLLGQGGR